MHNYITESPFIGLNFISDFRWNYNIQSKIVGSFYPSRKFLTPFSILYLYKITNIVAISGLELLISYFSSLGGEFKIFCVILRDLACDYLPVSKVFLKGATLLACLLISIENVEIISIILFQQFTSLNPPCLFYVVELPSFSPCFRRKKKVQFRRLFSKNCNLVAQTPVWLLP